MPTAVADVRVLAVNLDELTLERFKASFRGTELQLYPVSWSSAMETAASMDAPIIVVLEWVESDAAELVRFCEALRAVVGPGRCHIVAMGTLTEQSPLLLMMDGTVDDVLYRPFGPDLVFRFRHAALALQKRSRVLSSPATALDEALTSQNGGEVVVRSGDATAFIHVQNGQVAWANVSSAPASMEEVLSHANVQLERDIINAVKEEARASRKHFMQVLVSWNLIEESDAQEAVRAFVAGRVEQAIALPDAVALFLPKPRSHTERPRIHTRDIPSLKSYSFDAPPSSRFDVAPVSRSRTESLPMHELVEVVNKAVALDGALGAALLDRKTGASIAQAGAEMDSTVAWSQLAALAALGPHAEDVIAVTGEKCFVTRPLRFATTFVLVVALSLSSTTLGLARANVARLCSHHIKIGEADPRGQEPQD